ncbi:MAG: DNA mismatch repair endonuclease MutL [Firmicutes bacterium]|nr:DNA mismatch repair endonuclease MutL [Bacillota bacterium]
MSKIKIMDELLANKIAAGEVVEKCASVVKELVENSIDAESTVIKVELADSGIKEIKVTDNGVGMEREDAELAFFRHATSKIKDENDLFRINTLGFRGEALASIASVSKVTLKTSTGELGTQIEISGGIIENISNGDARQGTIISVRDLFFNTPARLKHLKSLQSELANIADFINKLALSHPHIKFTLVNNDTVILNTDGTGNLLKTINAIYGTEVSRNMFLVEDENEDYTVSGYISAPSIHRSNRNHIITLVNGRVVRNQELNRAINDSYHSYKPDSRYPIVVLNIEVDPSLIDVNIHPTKMDIKFSKFEQLIELVTNMIKNKIGRKNLIPKVEVKPELFSEKPKYEEMTLNLERISETEEKYSPIIMNEDFENNTIEHVIENVIENDILETKERMPEIYPVGLVHGTYIIGQNELGMYLIDQHAAKERINYEYYKAKLGNPDNESIALLFPFTIELTNSEFIIIKDKLEVLRNLKFDAEEFGINSLVIKAHPAWLPTGYEDVSTRKIIEIILNHGPNFSIEKFNEKIATTLSCKLAIKANENITLEEQEQLISDLRKCDNPFNCPHGRPTALFYSNYDLEKLFKRSGFDNIV